MRLFLPILLALIVSSCCSHKELAMTGNDRDENGCIPSAGYQWSKLTNKCVRPFELEIQLHSTFTDGTLYSAGIILSADKALAEVFLKEGTFLFEKQPDASYYSDADGMRLSLQMVNDSWRISSKGTTLYEQVK
ncbi:MAG: hypothetical protein RL632_763 [Bacteroidota bacterium]|jgi:hypothetical protein